MNKYFMTIMRQPMLTTVFLQGGLTLTSYFYANSDEEAIATAISKATNIPFLLINLFSNDEGSVGTLVKKWGNSYRYEFEGMHKKRPIYYLLSPEGKVLVIKEDQACELWKKAACS